MAVSVAEVGERPSFISLSHCDGMHPNLLGERDSICDHVCMDGWVSLVTVCLRLPQEVTHTASHKGCWCGVVGGQLDGLW